MEVAAAGHVKAGDELHEAARQEHIAQGGHNLHARGDQERQQAESDLNAVSVRNSRCARCTDILRQLECEHHLGVAGVWRTYNKQRSSLSPLIRTLRRCSLLCCRRARCLLSPRVECSSQESRSITSRVVLLSSASCMVAVSIRFDRLCCLDWRGWDGSQRSWSVARKRGENMAHSRSCACGCDETRDCICCMLRVHRGRSRQIKLALRRPGSGADDLQRPGQAGRTASTRHRRSVCSPIVLRGCCITCGRHSPTPTLIGLQHQHSGDWRWQCWCSSGRRVQAARRLCLSPPSEMPLGVLRSWLRCPPGRVLSAVLLMRPQMHC